jgi:hypothetical protein
VKKPRPLTPAMRRAQRRRNQRDIDHRIKTVHHNRYASDPAWQVLALAARQREAQLALIAAAAQLPALDGGGQ